MATGVVVSGTCNSRVSVPRERTVPISRSSLKEGAERRTRLPGATDESPWAARSRPGIKSKMQNSRLARIRGSGERCRELACAESSGRQGLPEAASPLQRRRDRVALGVDLVDHVLVVLLHRAALDL